MYFIAAIGILTIGLSIVMIVNPKSFSRGILRFSGKPYFHIAEVALRLLFGAGFIYFAGETMFPTLIRIIGGGLLAVGLFLILIGSKRHIEFAEKSATFTGAFRPAGFFSLAFGFFLNYIALIR
jgi:hypothetical protein